MFTFPLELYDQIITELRPDTDAKDLNALSLTCRSLAFLSQKVLFSHIILRSPVQCCPHLQAFGGTASAFKKLLSSSPHLSSFVRCLELFDRSGWPLFNNCPVHPEWRKEERWIIHDKVLHTCLPLLQGLQALTLTYHTEVLLQSTWNDMPVPLVSAIRSILQYPSLIHVDMEDTPIISLLQNTGSTVKHLVVHTGNRNGFLEELGDSLNPRRIYLESLCLRLTCDPSQLENSRAGIGSLQSNISLSRLKKLVVSIQTDRELERSHKSLQSMLEECAGSLEELVFLPSLDIAPIDTASFLEEFDEPIDLSKSKSLRRFHIFLEFTNEHQDGIFDSMPWFINLLRNCSAYNETLEELAVTLDLQFNTESDDIISSWNDVADILLGGRFPKLRAVRMAFRHQGVAAMELFDSSRFAKRLRETQLIILELRAPTDYRGPFSDFLSNPSWRRTDDK